MAYASPRSDSDRYCRLRLGQRHGGSLEEIRPGDVVWFAPGEKHWHGAAGTTAMTHIAIQEALNGKLVDWMEKVSDEQYKLLSKFPSRERGSSFQRCYTTTSKEPKMDREHVKGAADKSKGAIKEAAGKVSGDRELVR